MVVVVVVVVVVLILIVVVYRKEFLIKVRRMSKLHQLMVALIMQQ